MIDVCTLSQPQLRRPVTEHVVRHLMHLAALGALRCEQLVVGDLVLLGASLPALADFTGVEPDTLKRFARVSCVVLPIDRREGLAFEQYRTITITVGSFDLPKKQRLDLIRRWIRRAARGLDGNMKPMSCREIARLITENVSRSRQTEMRLVSVESLPLMLVNRFERLLNAVLDGDAILTRPLSGFHMRRALQQARYSVNLEAHRFPPHVGAMLDFDFWPLITGITSKLDQSADDEAESGLSNESDIVKAIDRAAFYGEETYRTVPNMRWIKKPIGYMRAATNRGEEKVHILQWESMSDTDKLATSLLRCGADWALIKRLSGLTNRRLIFLLENDKRFFGEVEGRTDQPIVRPKDKNYIARLRKVLRE